MTMNQIVLLPNVSQVAQCWGADLDRTQVLRCLPGPEKMQRDTARSMYINLPKVRVIGISNDLIILYGDIVMMNNNNSNNNNSNNAYTSNS